MTRLSDRELAALAREFKRERKKIWHQEREKYIRVKDLSEAIDAALGLRPCDRIHDHQYRVGRAALVAAQEHLQQRAKSLAAAKDFCELHDIVEQVSRHVRRFGKLATYDVAHRIGIFRGKEPKLVYLHAGTKEGASALGVGGDRAELAKFPKALRVMSPAELEDFLCICKAALRGAVSYSSACRRITAACSGDSTIC